MLIFQSRLRSSNGPEYDRGFPDVHIFNTGEGTKSSGCYVIEMRDKNGKVYRRGVVRDFPRLRKGPWELLRLGLNDIEKRYGHDESGVHHD